MNIHLSWHSHRLQHLLASTLAGLAAAFSLGHVAAAQGGLAYTFVTGDDPFGSPLAPLFAGQSVSGVLTYDTRVPQSGVAQLPPTAGSSVYAGGMRGLMGNVGGLLFQDPVGRVVVGDDRYTTPPEPADILVLAGDPSLSSPQPSEDYDFTGFTIAGHTLVNARLFWFEGLGGAGDFLQGQGLPMALPEFEGRLALDFVPSGTSGPLTSVFFDLLSVASASQWLSIDVQPGSDVNSVHPSSRGSLAVAILTTRGFDALTVDPLSVAFGPAGAHETHGRGHACDIDADGDLDLLLHFRIRASGIECGDTEVVLTGVTFEGQAIAGRDALRTVGCR